MKKRFWYLGGVLLLILVFWVVGGQAHAALELSLGAIKQVDGAADVPAADLVNVDENLIEAYYSNPSGRDPRDTTGKLLIAADIGTYNTNAPVNPADWNNDAKFKGYISGGNFFFTRHTNEDSPGATVFVRVWSANPNAAGGYYSAVKSFSNGTTSTVSKTLNATTSYKAAKPYVPAITQFEETTTSPVGGVASASLSVRSGQPAAVDGIREVTRVAWEWGTDPDDLADVGGNSANLGLDAAALEVGQTYYFKVTYTNWFGGESSGVEDHTLAGGALAEDQEITLELKKPGAKPGINFISLPFKDNYAYFENGVDRINENVAAPGTNKVETAYELIRVINRAAGGHVVASFGEWDINNQSDTGILIPADKTELDAPFDGQLQGKPLKSEEGYQIYIREVEGIDTERIAFKIKSQP